MITQTSFRTAIGKHSLEDTLAHLQSCEDYRKTLFAEINSPSDYDHVLDCTEAIFATKILALCRRCHKAQESIQGNITLSINTIIATRARSHISDKEKTSIRNKVIEHLDQYWSHVKYYNNSIHIFVN